MKIIKALKQARFNQLNPKAKISPIYTDPFRIQDKDEQEVYVSLWLELSIKRLKERFNYSLLEIRRWLKK